MCGIWGIFGFEEAARMQGIHAYLRTKHRGPDAGRLEHDIRARDAILGFHRLAIMDGLHGMQPMRLHRYPHVILVCNGEIYNFQKLREEYALPCETNCDVEVIIHLYKTHGIDKTLKSLDGVFAFCLVDTENGKIFIGRDPYGVRPLFALRDPVNGALAISSEAKSLVELRPFTSKKELSHLDQFAPGSYEVWRLSSDGKVSLEKVFTYYEPGDKPAFKPFVPEQELATLEPREAIAKLLEMAVRKRLMAERRVGTLLSGGLDSSLVAALMAKAAKEANIPYRIQTFAIGMGNSPDLVAARKVAKHLDTEHHEIIFTEEDVERYLDDVIVSLESYDITTVRASLPMYILSKYIRENTDTTVILSGEGSDELAQGYIYFRDAPSPEDAHNESKRLLKDIHRYDGLRADRTTSAFGLELRVPFLDLQFTHYYLNLPKDMCQPRGGIEKHLLRSSFDGINLLPDEILWRHKEAFSDGVASVKKSLFQIIQELVDQRLGDIEVSPNGFPQPKPHTKEAFYYRSVFEKHYKGLNCLIPYYWMPKWTEAKDPSARFINHYKVN